MQIAIRELWFGTARSSMLLSVAVGKHVQYALKFSVSIMGSIRRPGPPNALVRALDFQKEKVARYFM